MFEKIRLSIVLLFVVSLFTIAKCIHEDELIRAPISVAKAMDKQDNLILQRQKRQVNRIGAGRPYPSVEAQSRAPTVIVVPERGYGNVPVSPYSVSSPNRGTTVVVSQVPEYGYNGGYNVMPNPIRI